MIEFTDAAHARALTEIASRLGFDLVSHRLELFGRRRVPATADAPAAPRPAGRRRAPAAPLVSTGPDPADEH